MGAGCFSAGSSSSVVDKRWNMIMRVTYGLRFVLHDGNDQGDSVQG